MPLRRKCITLTALLLSLSVLCCVSTFEKKSEKTSATPINLPKIIVDAGHDANNKT